MNSNYNEFTLISIPTEALEEAGIVEGCVIQAHVENGKLILEPVTVDDFECDGLCEDCPFSDECGGEE